MKRFSFLLLITFVLTVSCRNQNNYKKVDESAEKQSNTLNKDTLLTAPLQVLPGDTDRIQAIIPTFLGNAHRNYYGNIAPSSLDVIWTFDLGVGITRVGSTTFKWGGAGWTGQPLLVEEKGHLYLIQGAYDHHLRKINALTGEEVWRYRYDDVIKGTGTLWENKAAENPEERYVILQGSRQGLQNSLASKVVPSYRAISYLTGKELWRLNVRRTKSYSRDVDASALVLNDTAYIGLENGIFTMFNPNPKHAKVTDGILQPVIYFEDTLYQLTDHAVHGGNLVTESSPALLGNRIYLASGSGHVYGFNLETKQLDWDFFIGSDIDGSCVVTTDGCLLVSVEKQYIRGKGGVFKLNPALPPEEAVVWYFPVDNYEFASWHGGIIGSVGTNDYSIQNLVRTNNCNPLGYSPGNYSLIDQPVIPSSAPTEKYPHLAAFIAIDKHLYVVDHQSLVPDKQVLGPDGQTKYPTPELVFKHKTGPSISTPLLVGNKLIAATYEGLYLFEYNTDKQFRLVEYRPELGAIESTPIVHNRRLYIASRNGLLYCLGDKWFL